MEKVRGCARSNSRWLIGGAGRCAPRPIKNCILELQSDAETSVREPLTINNSGKRPQISRERLDYEPVVLLFGSSVKMRTPEEQTFSVVVRSIAEGSSDWISELGPLAEFVSQSS